MKIEKQPHSIYTQSIALQALIFQIFLATATNIFAFWISAPLFEAIAWLTISGIPIWLSLFIKEKMAVKDMSNLQDPKRVEKSNKTRKIAIYLKKRVSLIFEFLFIGTLLYSGYSIFNITLKQGVDATTYNGKILIILAISAVLSFMALTTLFYFRQAIKKFPTNKMLTSGVNLISIISISFCIGTIVLCGAYLKIPKIIFYTTLFISGSNLLIGTETLLKIFLRFFTPHIKKEEHRAAFDSYLYGIIINPTNIKKTFTNVINNQLGFDISKSAFVRMSAGMALPFLLLSIIILIIISSITLIKPYEKGIVLRFGNITDRVLEPGIHFTAPWPIDLVRKEDVWIIKRTHVGSHQPKDAMGNIYIEGKPILWTNLHGVVLDELMITAPPSDLMEKTGSQKGDKKSPSISLVGADILVEYRIKDIKSYLSFCGTPDVYFNQIAEAESSRALYQYDIDELFREGQIILPQPLKGKIQEAADKASLGIEVLNVGIGGMHPPQDVASAFQETVVALQQKETSIEYAKQYALKLIIEAAGGVEISKKLLSAIEKPTATDTPEEILETCSGYVSEILANAHSYRWEQENREHGKAIRFKKKLLIYNESPELYTRSYYMSLLEKNIGYARKYIIIGKRKQLTFRFNFSDLN